MKQYNAIKGKHPGALLLFRVGDFYETFGEDAVTASRILNITLTKRSNGSASEVALAGFPHHALDNYLPKLVRAGQRVAICDQLEDPKTAIGVVKRGVTELVTPGVSMHDQVLDGKNNNWLASIIFQKQEAGVAFCDISTGEFYAAQGPIEQIDKIIQSFQPAEVVFCKAQRDVIQSLLGDQFNVFGLEEWVFSGDFGYETLKRHFKTNNLKGFGIEDYPLGIIAGGAIVHYLEETEHREINHINAIARIEEEHVVWLDKFTIRNLELVYPQHEGGIPLVNILDKTTTPMGGRLLRKWVLMPLKDPQKVQERLNMVETLKNSADTSEALWQLLRQFGDLERLISKVAVRRINPREMVVLKRTLSLIGPIQELLSEFKEPEIQLLTQQLNPCKFLQEKIASTLVDEPPMLTNQGGMIRKGIHHELDELHQIAFHGKDYLIQVQQREIERTGISSLKIAFNKVFGYYLEVTNSHKDKVPSDWIRKQTLVNAERYITPELKEFEEKILHAEEKISQIEWGIYQKLVEDTGEFILQIQQNAKAVSAIDCLLSFARVANENNYCKPELSDEVVTDIKDGRHPVIEKQLPTGEVYVPNDVFIDDKMQQIIIITGPNMAGKSALLRQTALISLMAQMGSFVPASYAKLGLVDKVFTRVGASDNLSKGESTFMVEMTETASILNNLSARSLIIMDEIGRGTSTYDGISIAWAIVEHLHNHPKHKARTLFATHYHELNELAKDFPRIKNFNVAVKEAGNKVIFLRKLKAGGSEHSFGILVAQMAGIPIPVVLRAGEIMHHLEEDQNRSKHQKKIKEMPKQNYQLSLFEPPDPNVLKVKEMLSKIDINATSPVEALLRLNEIKLTLKV